MKLPTRWLTFWCLRLVAIVGMRLTESFGQRLASQGWRTVALLPAVKATAAWAVVFTPLCILEITRHGASATFTFVFGVLTPITLGVLSALVGALWGRQLRLSDDGRVSLHGRRRIILADGNLGEVMPEIECDKDGYIVLHLAFQKANGKRKHVTFTTKCSKTEVEQLKSMIGKPEN